MIGEEPVHTIEGPAALFIGGERDDDVAIGREPFFFVLNQVGEPDGGLGFVVAGATAVEIAVTLDELEWIHAPVFALGFYDVGMGEQEDGLQLAGSAITDDEIGFARNRTAEKDVGVGESGGFEARGSGFGDGSRGAGGEAGLDFDESLVDVMSELFLGVGPHRLRIERSG